MFENKSKIIGVESVVVSSKNFLRVFFVTVRTHGARVDVLSACFSLSADPHRSASNPLLCIMQETVEKFLNI